MRGTAASGFAPARHLPTRAATARLVAATTIGQSLAITVVYEGANMGGSLIRVGVNRGFRYFGD